MKRTIKELAQEAIDVQDACNLMGVLNGSIRALSDLRAVLGNTQWTIIRAETHPIMLLWASKILHLSGADYSASEPMASAYDACKDIAQEGKQ